MKNIRQRITRPLVWIAVLVPLAILLVFNGIMRLYMLDAARDDLTATTSVIQALVREDLKSTLGNQSDALDQALPNNLAAIRSIVRTTSRVTGADILVVNKNGVIIFPDDIKSLDMNTPALSRFRMQLAKGLTEGQIETLRAVNGQYLYLGFPIRQRLPAQSPWVICLVRYNPTQGFLLVTNLILLGILILGSLFSILITLRTARRISDPLRRLHHFAEQVGQGNFTPNEPDSYCTEVTELQLQLNAMTSGLAQADNLQKTFLQNASHELRTPLMAIQGYAEGLESGVLTDVPKAAAIIGAESRRLNHLVESLLTLSRIENLTGHINLMPLQLNDWLQDQVQRAQGLGLKADKIIVFKPSDNAIVVSADEGLLGQAVTNILANAVRFARKTVVMQSGIDRQGAWIVITDDGPGIAPDDLPHIFERFYKGAQGQHGLGLAIAYSAVTALRGSLTAANSPSGGAVFTIDL